MLFAGVPVTVRRFKYFVPFRWWYFEPFVIPLTHWHHRGPFGPPLASGEILIHRSHGCSSNPPTDAPSLLPRQRASSDMPVFLSAWLSLSICPSICLSNGWSLNYKNCTLEFKGAVSEVCVGILGNKTNRRRNVLINHLLIFLFLYILNFNLRSLKTTELSSCTYCKCKCVKTHGGWTSFLLKILIS